MRSLGALEGIRTPNLLIRSQMLYPLSYERFAVWLGTRLHGRPGKAKTRAWAMSHTRTSHRTAELPAGRAVALARDAAALPEWCREGVA